MAHSLLALHPRLSDWMRGLLDRLSMLSDQLIGCLLIDEEGGLPAARHEHLRLLHSTARPPSACRERATAADESWGVEWGGGGVCECFESLLIPLI